MSAQAKKKTRKPAPRPGRPAGARLALSWRTTSWPWKAWLTATGVVAVVAVAIWGAEWGRARLRLREAEALLGKGFATLAAERLEGVRSTIASSERGCKALIAAYLGAHQPERLEWASQACITAGIETTDTYIGLAAAKEIIGQDNDALRILEGVAKKFDKSPDPLYRIAQIYRRNKKTAEAADVLAKAADLAKDQPQLSMEAMEAYSEAQRWDSARKFADRIKGVSTDNPEVKLMISRAMLKGGDREGARALALEARKLMDAKPQLKQALEQAYSDVLNDTPGSPAGKLAGPTANEARREPASPEGGSAAATDAAEGAKIRRSQPPLSPATPPKAF
jgi:tetratricopeptide (TPR) repeat protein